MKSREKGAIYKLNTYFTCIMCTLSCVVLEQYIVNLLLHYGHKHFSTSPIIKSQKMGAELLISEITAIILEYQSCIKNVMLQVGTTQRIVACILNGSQSDISRLRARYRQTRNVIDRLRSGRQRVTNPG